MTHDDATIERVARAICEATSGPFEMLDDVGRDALRCEARAALSAMPHAALMREAMEALTFVVETRDCNHFTASDTFRDYYAQSCPICRARAAAQRLRDAMGGEKQT